jgi:sigma-E factor negative regulatory protein RseB
MSKTNNKMRFLALGIVAIAAGHSVTTLAQQSPGEWLERMTYAVASTSYHGTVIRRKRGESEALKVVHKIVDGVVNERVTSQEGNGLEIIRIGNDVHCILPDKKSVLVEGWNNQSTLFSPLPQTTVVDMPQYDLSLMREGRVAGRTAVLISIRPHDSYRYAHRIWLDKASGFPLQTEVLDIDGELIEEVKFADITFSDDILAEALDPSISLDGFTWYKEPSGSQAVDVETDWASDDLPAGFRAISTTTEKASAEDVASEATTRIVYSDGVAKVSVFIESSGSEDRSGWAVLGAANSFSVASDGYQITAVGEVPGITVQRIASSMRQQ